jgi:hypothetical protein
MIFISILKVCGRFRAGWRTLTRSDAAFGSEAAAKKTDVTPLS